MSYENKGSMATTVTVSRFPDPSGNFVCSTAEAHDVTIQRAMDHVGSSGGGIVRLLNGTYWTTAALIPNYDGITLQGQNMQTTIIRATAGSTHNIIERTAGDNVFFFTIRDLHIYGTDTPGCGNGIHLTAGMSDAIIECVRISYCYDGLYGGGWGAKIYRLVAEHNLHDGIHTLGNQIQLIACYSADNDYDGIVVSTDTIVLACFSYENGHFGLKLGSIDNQVIGGHLFNNYLIEAGTKVELWVSSDRNIITGMHIDGNSASNVGIWLDDGADDNIVKNNNLLNCTWWEIYIGGARNWVKNNILSAVNDAGTDTKLAWIFCRVTDPNDNLGSHPVVRLEDDTDTYVYDQVLIPLEFQQLVTAEVIVVQSTGANPNMVWTCDTDWGKLCAGEDYLEDSDTTGATSAMAQDDLVCLDFSAALTGIAAGDLIGVSFMRDGDNGADTINGPAYYLGIRVRYV